MLEQRITEWMRKVLAAQEAPGTADTFLMLVEIDRIIAEEFDQAPVLAEKLEQELLELAIMEELLDMALGESPEQAETAAGKLESQAQLRML